MIKNLLGAGNIVREADVVIVGAGTVGLVMSVLLSNRSSLSVICLESGDMHQEGEEHSLNEVVQEKSIYAGALSGRFRCIGGTSTRWGGALIPFLDSDLANYNWPITMADLEKYIPEVEKIFSLAEGSYDLDEEICSSYNATHTPRLAKWPPFKKRNVYNIFNVECNHDKGPEIWINATATDFYTDSGELKSIVARSHDGSEIKVSAKKVILAAGAIETTRMALLIDKQNSNIISKESPSLGKFFSYHISLEVAEIEARDLRKLNKIVGFRFEKNGMRNLRFELANKSSAREEIPPCFAHISFTTNGNGGFDALRDVFRALQKRRSPSIKMFLKIITSLPWFLKALWWRIVEKRLLFPADAKIMVHMVIEQVPNAQNRITLSGIKTDSFGKELSSISWSVTDQDIDNLTKSVDFFEKMWADSKLSSLAIFKRHPNGIAEKELSLGGGIYHPTGSTRMASTAHEGVVDKDLRIFSLPNVYLVSTSVLPNGGGANPTMMLFLLGIRCVDNILKSKN